MSVAQPPVLRKVEEPSIDILIESQKDLIKNLDGMFTGFKNKPDSIVDKHLPLISLTLLNINSNINKIFSQNFDSFKNSFNENLKHAEDQETKIRRSDFGKTHKKREKNNTGKKTFTNLFDGLKKGFDKLYDVISSNSAVKGISEVTNQLIAGALGPLNLVVGPLQDLLGVNFTDMIGKIFQKDNPKDKGKKVKPSDSDIKQANPETYWLWKKIFGKKDKKKEKDGRGIGGFFGKIFGGMSFAGIGAKILKKLNPELFSKITGGLKSLFTFIFKGNLFENIGNLLAKTFPKLIGKKFVSIFSKAGPIAMIVGGLAMAVKDGIKGLTQGWKTSKISNFAGSFLGGVDKGIKGAFKNMGKWAVLGAGVGSFVPVVGTVLGGILGAVVGGILGFIGGENIAKAFDAVGSFVNKWIIQPIVTFFKFIGGKINEYVIQPVAGFFKMIGNFFYEKVITPVVAFVSPIIEKVVDSVQWFGRWFYKFFMLKELGEVLSKVFKKFKGISNWVKDNILTPIGNFFKKAVSGLSSGLKWISDKVLAPIGEFFKEAWGKMKDAGSWVKENILSPIGTFFVNIFNGFKDGLGWVKDNVLAPIGTFFGNLFTAIAESEIGQFFKEKIINPIKGFFSYIGSLFGFFFSGEINILDLIMGVTEDGREKLAESFDNYVKATQVMDTDDYKKFDTEKQSKDKKWNSKLVSEKYEAYKSAMKVNDAIITPAGRIIEPSSQDTIIATKSPVIRQKKGFDSEDMKINLSEISEKFEQSSKGMEIVNELKKVVEAIKEKPFNNVFQQNEIRNTDFDRYRFAF